MFSVFKGNATKINTSEQFGIDLSKLEKDLQINILADDKSVCESESEIKSLLDSYLFTTE
jgi:hypothetical protein